MRSVVGGEEMSVSTKKIIGEEKVLLSELGRKISKLRAENNLSRNDLADLAELNVQYLYDVEVGKRNITIYVLAKLARALNTTPSKLLKSNELKPL